MRASVWKIGIIAGATDALTSAFHLTPFELGLTVTSALLGTIPGAAFAGIPGNSFGGRASLKALGLIYVVSALGCAFAWNWPAFLVFRIIGGLGIGGCSVGAPMYIAEVSPAAHRGRMVGLFQVNVVIGILLAYVSNFLVSLLRFGAYEWRWKFGVAAVPAMLFWLMLFGIVESPRWLLGKRRDVEARESLERIGNDDPDGEYARIRFALRTEEAQNVTALFSPQGRKPVFLAVTIAAVNQLSGINAILYYLNDIFAAAGFSKLSGNVQAVIVGL